MTALTKEQIDALPGLVEPLVWVDLHKDGSCFVVCSDHPLGYSDSIARTLDGGWFFAGDLFSTLEAAKAAAQVDYEARILSALDLSTVIEQQAEIERLREALEDADQTLWLLGDEFWRRRHLSALTPDRAATNALGNIAHSLRSQPE
ncbi:hypothetical protein KLEP181_gp62 [Paracoccus phage vB_PmaP_KLEP18-1]|nr:hypothetical protein KLEP181_gp62 [Paracoccus phage vB_PmaP_KLEP18-1]